MPHAHTRATSLLTGAGVAGRMFHEHLPPDDVPLDLSELTVAADVFRRAGLEIATPGDVLHAAAHELAARGKATGRYYDPHTGCVCTLGAILYVLHGHTNTSREQSPAPVHDLYRRALLLLLTTIGHQICDLPDPSLTRLEDAVAAWSDTTPQPTIVATLTRAATLTGRR